jgi:hypothetical protein
MGPVGPPHFPTVSESPLCSQGREAPTDQVVSEEFSVCWHLVD